MAEDRNRRVPHEGRNYFERAADEVRAWFGDENAERRNAMGARGDRHDADRSAGDHPSGHGSALGRPGDAHGGSYDADKGFFGSGYGSAGDRWARGPEMEARGNQNFGGAPHQAPGYPAHHEPEYRAWRDEQARQLDHDYAEFRRHRQSRFREEFENWRTSRNTVMGAELTGEKWRTKIRAHQEVLGIDGGHVGTVDCVEGDHIKLTREDVAAGGEHHFIPLSEVVSVDVAVRLRGSAGDARQRWRGENRGSLNY